MPAECDVLSRFEEEEEDVDCAGFGLGRALSGLAGDHCVYFGIVYGSESWIFLFEEEELGRLVILSEGDFPEGGIDLSRSLV